MAAEQWAQPVAAPGPGASFDLAAAYAVQDATRRARAGPLVGAKLGMTSPDAQQAFAIDGPLFGQLTAAMDVTGRVLDTGPLIAPGVEVELVFVLDGDAGGADATAATVRAATSAWMVGIEVFDSRWSGAVSAAEIVADNVHAARFALGDPVPGPPSALVGCRASLHDDSGTLQAGAITSDPAADVAALVRFFAGRDRTLPHGAVVLTGSIGPPGRLVPGTTLRAAIEGAPALELPTK